MGKKYVNSDTSVCLAGSDGRFALGDFRLFHLKLFHDKVIETVASVQCPDCQITMHLWGSAQDEFSRELLPGQGLGKWNTIFFGDRDMFVHILTKFGIDLRAVCSVDATEE